MLRAFLAIFFLISSFSVWAETQSQAQAPAKEWTLIVFMNGHNSLSEFTDADINEMEKVGSDNNVNMLVQWANNNNKNTKRLLIQRDQDENKVTSPVVQELPRVDMGNFVSLIQFIKWSVENYPAKKYMIVVWNHGFGWHKAFGLTEQDNNLIKPMDISSDDFTNHAITTPQLGEAMRAAARYIGHPVDLYGSDACSMASLEIATEMKDSVHYFIGSEELEGSDGWVYDQVLEQLEKSPTAGPLELGNIVADTYFAGNPDADKTGGLTLSVSDLTQLDPFLASMTSLRKSIAKMKADGQGDVWEAADMSQRFWYNSDYRDSQDFINNLNILLKDSDATLKIPPRLMTDLEVNFNKLLVHNIHSPKYYNAHGLTIWLPQYSKIYATHESEYLKLKFNQITGWNLMLKEIIRKSP